MFLPCSTVYCKMWLNPRLLWCNTNCWLHHYRKCLLIRHLICRWGCSFSQRPWLHFWLKHWKGVPTAMSTSCHILTVWNRFFLLPQSRQKWWSKLSIEEWAKNSSLTAAAQFSEDLQHKGSPHHPLKDCRTRDVVVMEKQLDESFHNFKTLICSGICN